MAKRTHANQPDLFADEGEPADILDGYDRRPYYEQVPKFLLDFKRERFEAEFARVKASKTFPWPDLTKAMLAEMSFNSNARVLYPRAQADAMRIEFAAEITRVYEIYGEAWMPLIYAVPDR